MIAFKSHKQKFMLLLVISVISFILIYSVAIKVTLDLRSECNEKRKLIENNKNILSDIKAKEKKIVEINKLIENKDKNLTNYHNYLLAVIGKYCKMFNVVIKKFPQSHLVKKDNYNIETHVITLKGSYNDLLKILYNLEYDEKLSGISSLLFESIPNYRNGKYELNLTLYVQNIYQYAKV